jgi:hypothetical protein
MGGIHSVRSRIGKDVNLSTVTTHSSSGTALQIAMIIEENIYALVTLIQRFLQMDRVSSIKGCIH